MTQLEINKPILEHNERLAAANRALLDAHGIFMLDLLASPGAGKTSLILATLEQLRERFGIAVIEGDIASDVDAQRIKATGVPAVQINTGGACHLEAAMIKRALEPLDLANLDLIIVENVGNLVCPTDFYLGEDAKVMILSVPEGHDKPLKYPGIFQAAEAVILNKIDTVDVFNFNEEQFRQDVKRLNPQATIFPVAAAGARIGLGIESWTQWLTARINARRQPEAQSQPEGQGQPEAQSQPEGQSQPGGSALASKQKS